MRGRENSLKDLRAQVFNDLDAGDDMNFEEDDLPRPIRKPTASSTPKAPVKPVAAKPVQQTEKYSFERAKEAIIDMWFDTANGDTFTRSITLNPMVISGRVVDDLLYITVQAYSSTENGQLGTLILHEESIMNRQDCRVSLQREYPARALLLRSIHMIPEEARCRPKPTPDASAQASPIMDRSGPASDAHMTDAEMLYGYTPSKHITMEDPPVYERPRLNLSAHLVNIVPESNFRLLGLIDKRQERFNQLEKELNASVEHAVKHESIHGELFHRKKVSSLKESLRKEMEKDLYEDQSRSFLAEGSLQALVKQPGKQELGLTKNVPRPKKNIEQFFPKSRNSQYKMVVSPPPDLFNTTTTAADHADIPHSRSPYTSSETASAAAIPSPRSPLHALLAAVHATVQNLTDSSLHSFQRLSTFLSTSIPQATSAHVNPALTTTPPQHQAQTIATPLARSTTRYPSTPLATQPENSTTHPSLLSSLALRSSLDASISSAAELALAKAHSATRTVSDVSIPSISSMAAFKTFATPKISVSASKSSGALSSLVPPPSTRSHLVPLTSFCVRRPSLLLLSGAGVDIVDARAFMRGLLRAVKR